MAETNETITKESRYISRQRELFFERSIFLEFREIAVIFAFEFKRIILTLKFFIALSLVLLPAIIFLNSISSEYEALILDMGITNFQKFSATGFTIIGQFLLQLISIMLVLDSFGKSANESMRRYFALPIRKENIFRGHLLAILSGIIITGTVAILIFDLILWIWTGISLTFKLILIAEILTIVGAILAIAITLLFISLANFFGFSSSIAIIPTLFLFYIIPFLVNFVGSFVYSIPKAYEWTFMYQLSIIANFWIQPVDGLQTTIREVNHRNAWIVISVITYLCHTYSKIIFVNSEK